MHAYSKCDDVVTFELTLNLRPYMTSAVRALTWRLWCDADDVRVLEASNAAINAASDVLPLRHGGAHRQHEQCVTRACVLV
jgi:hypothetical protein